MNDTGNIPFWDLNPATLLIAALILTIGVVCILAWLSGKSR